MAAITSVKYRTIGELVVPMVTWHGVWQRPLKSMVQSRALLWPTLGCGIDPEFAVRHEQCLGMKLGMEGRKMCLPFHDTVERGSQRNGIANYHAAKHRHHARCGAQLLVRWRISSKRCCSQNLELQIVDN